MKIVFSTQPAFLRNTKNKVIFSARLSLMDKKLFPIAKPQKKARLPIQSPKSLRKRRMSHFLYQGVLSLVILIAIVAGITWLVPKIYFKLVSYDPVVIESEEIRSPLGGDFSQGVDNRQTEPAVEEEKKYLPPVDESLPEGDWIVIPRIGVRSLLKATVNYEEALKTGVWLDPEFGRPGNDEFPMIVAGHRFGWKWWWKTDYWKYNSFYLLPDTEPGDLIEIISEKRKWIYEIYAGEEGEQISDYQANLILYTCKYLNSPIRHFRYARLLDPTKDSQDVVSLGG